MSNVGSRIGLAVACSLLAAGQSAQSLDVPAAGVPAHVIITAGHYYGHEAPLVTREDLSITQVFEQRTITGLISLSGTPLELFVLVDGCSSCEAAAKFDELRRFIAAQPATSAIGVAYMHAGQLAILEKPTFDRAKVIAALNPPTGARPADPFTPLAELIANWDRDPARDPAARRAILMISNGIDPGVNGGLLDPSADAAIAAAQRSDVTIFALYQPSSDYLSTDSAAIYAGQVQLAHVANESGGEAYLTGFGPAPTLAPFLADVAEHLRNQYRLEFLASPREAGSLEDVVVRCKLPDIELLVPAKAWVPGAADVGLGQ